AAHARVGPPCNVTSGKNSGDIGFQKLVYQYAIISCDTRLLSEMCVWANADSDNDQIAVQFRSVVKLHSAVVNCCGRPTEMKFHAMRFVRFANQIAHFRSQNFLEGHECLSEDRDF